MARERTIIHKIRHAEDHNNREQAHQDHWTLEEAEDVEPLSLLIVILLAIRRQIDDQLSLLLSVAWAQVTPLISQEALPDLNQVLCLALICACLGQGHIDPEWCEEVVAGVDVQEIGSRTEVFEDKGI